MISRLPAQAELYSLASFCLAAEIVPAAMYRLSGGLGTRFYIREGGSGMFQKLLRDLKPLGLDGAATAAAAHALVGTTSSSRLDNEPLPREVFRTPPGGEADEPPLSWRRPPGCGEPWRAGMVREALAHAAAEPDLRDLTALFERLERDRREPAPPAKRMVRLFAAAACAGTWLHHRDTDRFLGEPTWLRGALEMLLEPGGLGDAPISPDVEASLSAELCRRCEQGRGRRRRGSSPPLDERVREPDAEASFTRPPDTYRSRQRLRWRLPDEVFGTTPGATTATSSGARERSARAAKTLFAMRCRESRSAALSTITTMRSRSVIANAMALPFLTPGTDSATAS